MSYYISQKDLSTIQLNEKDKTASILQNIAVILSTLQKSVPMYREFGLPMKFLDKPLPVAKSLAYAEIKEAIEEFEPRAKVLSINFEVDAAIPGKLISTVEVEL